MLTGFSVQARTFLVQADKEIILMLILQQITTLSVSEDSQIDFTQIETIFSGSTALKYQYNFWHAKRALNKYGCILSLAVSVWCLFFDIKYSLFWNTFREKSI